MYSDVDGGIQVRAKALHHTGISCELLRRAGRCGYGGSAPQPTANAESNIVCNYSQIDTDSHIKHKKMQFSVLRCSFALNFRVSQQK